MIVLVVLATLTIALLAVVVLHPWSRHSRGVPLEPAPVVEIATLERAFEPSWLRPLMMSTVVVHTTEGISYEGLMVLEHEKGLMLRSPKLLDDGHSPIPMAGELWIGHERIHAVQTIPGGPPLPQLDR